jgi:hypothetical protein
VFPFLLVITFTVNTCLTCSKFRDWSGQVPLDQWSSLTLDLPLRSVWLHLRHPIRTQLNLYVRKRLSHSTKLQDPFSVIFVLLYFAWRNLALHYPQLFLCTVELLLGNVGNKHVVCTHCCIWPHLRRKGYFGSPGVSL